jgi:hypothetical protein
MFRVSAMRSQFATIIFIIALAMPSSSTGEPVAPVHAEFDGAKLDYVFRAWSAVAKKYRLTSRLADCTVSYDSSGSNITIVFFFPPSYSHEGDVITRLDFGTFYTVTFNSEVMTVLPPERNIR